MRVDATIFSFLALLCTPVFCDYDCVCNYNVEKSVFGMMDDQGSTVGYMYEFDCKQKLDESQTQQGWFAVAFEHKIGYVTQDNQIEVQLCSGDPPSADTVTTSQPQISSKVIDTSSPATKPVVSTSATSLPTTSLLSSATTTTTSAPTTVRTISTSFTLGNTSQCGGRVQQFAQAHRGILAQFNDKCYVLIKNLQHWLQAELDCNTDGGHLVSIESQAEQMYLYSFLLSYYHHSIWTGLSDRRIESHFEWSSGQPFYFVNWANHSHFSDTIEDCVVMDMHLHDGKWDDRDCSFELYPYICQYGLAGNNAEVTTQTYLSNSTLTGNQSDGNTQLCPEQVKRNTAVDGTVLGQYERGCYELHLNNKVSWEHGENICQANGGHLAHISNAEQQAFVEGFMQRHNPNHAVWLGLHDTISEGTFQWTAGNDVGFTNWIPGHQDNTLGGHNYEDCVAFVPQKQGYWDDVQCGYEEIFGHDSGEVHYALCQYKLQSAVAIVG